MTENDEEIVKKLDQGFLDFVKEVRDGNEDKAQELLEHSHSFTDTADDPIAVIQAHIANKDRLIAEAHRLYPE